MINLGLRIAERSNADFFINSFWAFGQTRNNNLFRCLQSFFEEKEIESAFNRYAVGTSLFNKWENACIFWKISKEGKYLAYKLIQYLPNGHRDPKISILQHSLVDSNSGEQRYCLFGLHLLNNPANQKKTICIVESEKTAIIASMAYPEGLWLATGSSRYLNKMNVDDIPDTMRDTIILFPDPDLEGDTDQETGIPDDWNVRKQWFKSLKGAKVSGFMKQYVETNRNELSKELGDKYKEFDIADYILRTKSEGGILAKFDDIIKE